MMSGYFLILLMLLIELGVLIFVQFYLDDVILIVSGATKEEISLIIIIVYLLLRAFASVVAFFIFFKIVNKPEDPEFKIPWIVGMLLLPLFTSLVYLIFGNHGLRKTLRLWWKQ